MGTWLFSRRDFIKIRGAESESVFARLFVENLNVNRAKSDPENSELFTCGVHHSDMPSWPPKDRPVASCPHAGRPDNFAASSISGE
jgi:hypothetical protein